MTDTTARTARLRDILVGRRRELQEALQRRMHDGRADRPGDLHDDLERTDADLSAEVAFALMQMKAETMSHVDEALDRLAAGDYGRCFECGVEISEARLQALPFAVRCRMCEETREQAQARTRRLAQQHAGFSFSEVIHE